MSITNEAKPSTSLTNGILVPVQYETFDSLTTTFATETRTFDQMATTWTNGSRPSTSITNVTKPS